MEAQGSTVVTRERKGEDGKDGRGVTKVDVVYNTSTSNSVAPTDWFTDAPNMKKGDYLWSANDVYYTDGTDTIVGANVVTSADNVKTVVEQYNVNTSRTSAPSQNDSGWGTASPTATEGSYIWTRSKITYQSGEVEYTNPVCVTGNKGEDGNDAVIYGIEFTTEYASVGTDGMIDAKYAGKVYTKIGSTKIYVSGATVRYGFDKGTSQTVNTIVTDSSGSFDDDDWFIGSYTWNDSNTCNSSTSIFIQVIIGGVVEYTHNTTLVHQGKNGADGTNGTNGGQLEIRRHENGFAANYQYFNGTTKQSDSNVFFLDYVFVENSQATSGYDVYRCIKNVIYSSVPTSYATDGNWQSVATNETDAYFNYIIAKSAFIKFLQTNSVSANSIITTHESGEPYVRIEGSLIQIFGTSAMNMQIGINSDGKPVLSYYDNDGRLLWDLGPSGFKNSDIEKGQWVEFTYVSLATIYLTSTPPSEGAITSLSDAQKLFKNNTNYALTTIYVYHAPKVNGSIIGDDTNGFTQPQASDFDGKYFSVKSSSGLLTGKFTNNNGGISIYDDESNAYKKVFMDIVSGVLTSRSWSCSSYYYNAANP